MKIINGTTSNDFLTGTAENDLMRGYAGDDKLIGGPGNDIIVGGFGNNTLTGGDGADTFVLNHTNSSLDMIAQIKQITDFSAANGDTMRFHDPLVDNNPSVPPKYKSIGAGQAKIIIVENDIFIYEVTTGNLFYDVESTGAIKQVQIETLSIAILNQL